MNKEEYFPIKARQKAQVKPQKRTSWDILRLRVRLWPLLPISRVSITATKITSEGRSVAYQKHMTGRPQNPINWVQFSQSNPTAGQVSQFK